MLFEFDMIKGYFARNLSLFFYPIPINMPDLAWTLPVARWSAWSAQTSAAPDVSFIEPMLRRRLSTLSKMGLKVAHDCVSTDQPVRVIFASRHGELRRTTELLKAQAQEPMQSLSPNGFSLSVLNAAAGVFSMMRSDHSNATALAAGSETLGYALLEAFAQYTSDPQAPILVIYADEPPDPIFASVDEDAPSAALALWIADDAPGVLECRVRSSERVQVPERPLYPRQLNAALHCLETHQATCWEGAGSSWSWQWRDRKA